MKNIIYEKPMDELHGRTKFTTGFISNDNINNKIILEIGCGYGWFLLFALNKGCKHITGLDVNLEDLSTAKKHIKFKNFKVQKEDATKLRFKDNSFDTVVMWDVLEHLPPNSELKVFKEIHRVLNDKGVFYLSTPYNHFFSKSFDPAWWLIGHRHYSMAQLKQYAKRTNFIIDSIQIKGGFIDILFLWDLYISKWIFRRRPFFSKLIFRWQDKEYSKPSGFNQLFVKFNKVINKVKRK